MSKIFTAGATGLIAAAMGLSMVYPSAAGSETSERQAADAPLSGSAASTTKEDDPSKTFTVTNDGEETAGPIEASGTRADEYERNYGFKVEGGPE